MSDLWVSASIEVKELKNIEEAKAALQILVSETVKEAGCLQFEIYQQPEKPECFTLWERWTDEDALKAHFEAAHTKAYFEFGYTELKYMERLLPIG